MNEAALLAAREGGGRGGGGGGRGGGGCKGAEELGVAHLRKVLEVFQIRRARRGGGEV